MLLDDEWIIIRFWRKEIKDNQEKGADIIEEALRGGK
jgi:very-short-patch-repair endonuclease